MPYNVEILVRTKRDYLDPEEEAVQRAISDNFTKGVTGLKMGQHFAYRTEAGTEEEARAEAKNLGDKLFRNPVMHDYKILSVTPAGQQTIT